MELRKYQTESVDNLRNALAKNKHVILQAACGAGKTIISAEIASKAIGKGSKVLFLVNRRDLISQTRDKYEQFGLGDEIGIIMAGEDHCLGKPIQLASLQTYTRRIQLDNEECKRWFHDADLVIYDEVHSANAPTYKKIIEMYADKYVIGLSATPMGAGGTGLGDFFGEIIQCVPTSELIKDGFLVPAIHYAPSKPDLSGIKMTAGDYNKKQLGERVDKPKLVGDLLENWLKIAHDRKTLVFATNVKHSKHIRDEFTDHGILIAHIDAHTKDEDRRNIYDSFENGDLQVITNVGVACEGSDLPIASCVCIARPTKVLSRWVQMAGRGARPYPGKTEYLLLDFAGCIDEHGYVDDEIDWSLDAKKPAAKKKNPRKKEKHIMTCEMCSRTFTGKRCPECGHEIRDYGKKIEALDAELVKVDKKKEPTLSTHDKQRWFAMFMYEQRRLGKSDKWLLAQYKSKTGVWPRNMDNIAPIEPTKDVKNWLTYQRIKWIKGQKNANRR